MHGPRLEDIKKVTPDIVLLEKNAISLLPPIQKVTRPDAA
jgi:hypothetical protein